jgi:hypothetical protein
MIPDWENNTHLLVENGVVKGFKSGVDASRYRNLAIPSTYWTEPITAIENGAFEKKQLTRVIIGSNVTTIGDNAFANNQLTSVGIPDSVTTIGSRAFFSNKLYSVFLGKGVVSIGDKAFRGDTAFSNGFPFTLTSVVIPASVTYIGYGAITINRYGVVTRFAGANVSYRDANEAITDGIGEDFPKYYKKKGMKAGKYTYKSIGGGWGIFTWNYSPE